MMSYIAVSAIVGDFAGMPDYLLEILAVAGTGLVAGFIIDDLIPAYIEKTRGGSGAGDFSGDVGGDIGGDVEGDIDFE